MFFLFLIKYPCIIRLIHFFSNLTPELNLTYEGKRRPDFFDGISLVCTKLFNIIKPNEVFFGQKDIWSMCINKKIN